MNRTIKFRGIDEETLEWVYGDLIHYDKWGDDKYTYQIRDRDGNHFNVIDKTVGQFTGLLDKKGKEIYEGDIIKANYKYDDVLPNGATNPDQDCMCIGEVKFSDEFMAFFLRIEKAECPISSQIGFYNECLIFLHDFDWCGDSAEVLGNIHDNPELLSSKQ